MEHFTRILKEYEEISFHYSKGKIDVIYSKQFHPYYELYLFLDGNAEFLNDHSRRPLAPNDLIIIPPGTYHCFLPDANDTDRYERCVLDIHSDFLGEDLLKEAFSGKEVLTFPSDHRIVENFMYLKDCAARTDEKDFSYILSAIATDIIFLIKQSSPSQDNKAHGSLRPVSVQMMEFINKNYKTNISTADIAKYVSFSASAVAHIFKEDFGVSIKRYITEKRMNEIYTCLQKGDTPSNVADTFGFSNYSSFYRSFRKHFGVSPFEVKRKKAR